MLLCLVVGSAYAATNMVTVTWKNPLVDIEGNVLPANAVASYDVLAGHQSNGTDLVIMTNIPPAAIDGGSGDAVQVATIPLTNGVWYVNVQAIDVIGQKGPITQPVVYTTKVAPGEVRDLQVAVEVTVNVNVNINQ